MIPIFKLDSIGKVDYERIMLRSNANIEQVYPKVREIIHDVRANGDAALVKYTRMWDDPEFDLDRLVVTPDDMKEAYEKTPTKTIRMIKEQIRLSTLFHKLQASKMQDWSETTQDGIIVGEKWTPIDQVGLYVPGGKNPFPTVQQILAVAAKTAGCPRIVSCISPKGNNYEVLIAANECGITEIYRVGGAQAIAAMAYGTETIKPVELIAGPGNPYVTAAKILCQERVAIDMPAGPSEALILADGSTNQVPLPLKADFIAADILARAEHGSDSAAVLVTVDEQLANAVQSKVEMQFEAIARKEYARKALDSYCAIIIASDEASAIDFVNAYAPEHLEVLTANPQETYSRIRNAGTVFLGCFNPVATGDYASGVNHILPTGGWARRASAVGVWTFCKRVQFSEVSKEGLRSLQPIVDTLADVEGLDAHRKSVDIRFANGI